MTSVCPGAAPRTTDRRAVLHRRVRRFVAGAIADNVFEASIALTAGTIASSAALTGSGLDPIVEVLPAALPVGLEAWRGDACCTRSGPSSPTSRRRG